MDQAPRSGLRNVTDLVSVSAVVITCAAVLLFLWRLDERLTNQRGEATSVADPAPPPPSPPPLPDHAIALDNAIIDGSPAAPVGVMEFIQYQCGACAVHAAMALPNLRSRYVDTGKVLHAIRQMPASAASAAAAEMAVCARKSGVFRTVHDSFFGVPLARTEDEFSARLTKAGLDYDEIARCRAAGEATTIVRQDMALARLLKVPGTPTLFVGRMLEGRLKVIEILMGAKPLSELERVIEAALAAPNASVPGAGVSGS